MGPGGMRGVAFLWPGQRDWSWQAGGALPILGRGNAIEVGRPAGRCLLLSEATQLRPEGYRALPILGRGNAIEIDRVKGVAFHRSRQHDWIQQHGLRLLSALVL